MGTDMGVVLEETRWPREWGRLTSSGTRKYDAGGTGLPVYEWTLL